MQYYNINYLFGAEVWSDGMSCRPLVKIKAEAAGK